MKVSLNWLNQHLDTSGDSVDQLADLLTFAGVEVEDIETRGDLSEKLVIGQIKSSEKHPNADKLSVCKVDDGSGEEKQIVCGAKNYSVGDKIPVAQVGARMPGGFKIKRSKMRGELSEGMLCSAGELGMPDEVDGLWILPEDAAIGAPVSSLVDKDTIFEIEVTPNRPDLLSHLGMARELAALTEKPLKGTASHHETTATSQEAKQDEVDIRATEACPLYSARRIKGVTVKESPAWLKQRLESIGLRPINNIVDITNFVLMEMGQPLHAFDQAKLDGGIVVRLAAAGEKFLALDGEEYDLETDDLVIADQSRAVAIGGVMGGEESGVTETTTDVLLESAYFNPPNIRRTSRRLVLTSDSSYRFERGIDPQQTLGASEFATKLILELAGGEAEDVVLVSGDAPTLTGTVELDSDRCRSLIGADIPQERIDGILSQLGLEKSGENGWAIPSYRADLQRHVDLVEEVARVYGIEHVPAQTAAIFSEINPTDTSYDFKLRVKSELAARGFYEAHTIKLISDKQLDDVIGCGDTSNPIGVKNKLSDDHTMLRPSTIPGLLGVVARNVRMGATTQRFFEVGTVFQDAGADGAHESQSLGIVAAGENVAASWIDPEARNLDVFDLAGVLQTLAGDQRVTFAPSEHPKLSLAGRITVGKTDVGTIGLLPPSRTRELDVATTLAVAEIDLAALQGAIDTTRHVEELPRFPAITRDIAMEVPGDLENAKLASFFDSLTEPLLVGANVFDVFTDPSGEKLAADRKSIAYSLTYRDKKKTLESAEVDAAHERVLKALKDALPVETR